MIVPCVLCGCSIDVSQAALMDRIIEQVKGIDSALFSCLMDRLSDSFIDPIIMKADEVNDRVYLVGERFID